MVAFTTHDDPASPGVNTPLAMVHVPDTTENVTAPLPEPPEEVSVSGWPYVADVDETMSAACVVRAVETDVASDDTAL